MNNCYSTPLSIRKREIEEERGRYREEDRGGRKGIERGKKIEEGEINERKIFSL